METPNKRQRTLLRITCYLLYRLIAQHLPDDLGPVGRASRWLRRVLIRPLLKESEGLFNVYQGVDLGNGSCVVMRDHANLGPGCMISGSGTVTVGRHVMMGAYCMLITENHRYLPVGYDGSIVEDILVDDHAWLGHRVILLPGVRIGKHAIVGAGAVVSRDVPDYAIAVGVPARVVKDRRAAVAGEDATPPTRSPNWVPPGAQPEP
jgi:maltose O-acetyltransferase